MSLLASIAMSGPTWKKAKGTRIKALTSKVCRDCGKEKLMKYFQTCGKHDDGTPKYGSYCLPCCAVRNKEARRKNAA